MSICWLGNVRPCKIKASDVTFKTKIQIKNRRSSRWPRPAGTAPAITKPSPGCSLGAILFTRYGFRTVTGQWGTELTQTDSLKKRSSKIMIFGSCRLLGATIYVVWSILDPIDVVHIVRAAFARLHCLGGLYFVIKDWWIGFTQMAFPIFTTGDYSLQSLHCPQL